MVNPKLAETAIKTFVQSNGPLSVRNLKRRTGFPKSIINAILHKNRNYVKIAQSPFSSKNKKVIWKFRVLSPPKDATLQDDKPKDAAPSA
jgi:hypothetical protein